MCETCGCADGAVITVEGEHLEHVHVLPDGTRIAHSHATSSEKHPLVKPPAATLEELNIKILHKNDRLAEQNRASLKERKIAALNLMSSPGAGKTALLVRTLRELGLSASVLEGDQATSNDAERIRATGTPAVQINTGKGCHLEAEMVARGLAQLAPPPSSVLFIENVGNLVCPALFDLGEQARVVLFSVTEGEDKPFKYPHMFRAADLVLLTKIDLLPHLDFDLSLAKRSVAEVAPRALVFEVSAKNGEGLAAWYRWIKTQVEGVN